MGVPRRGGRAVTIYTNARRRTSARALRTEVDPRLAGEGGFPSPLWGRVREGGRAALAGWSPQRLRVRPAVRTRSRASRILTTSVRATPHPDPPPQGRRG